MMKKWRNICSKHKNTAVSQDFLGPAKRRYSSFLFFVYRPLQHMFFQHLKYLNHKNQHNDHKHESDPGICKDA